jgi:hypothetical protein
MAFFPDLIIIFENDSTLTDTELTADGIRKVWNCCMPAHFLILTYATAFSHILIPIL